MRLHRAGLVGYVLMFAGLSLAQSRPDALDILNKVGETYLSVKTLQAEADVTTGIAGPGMEQKVKMHVRLAMGASNKVRMETMTGTMKVLLVSDGQTMWLFIPGMNKYSRLPAAQADTAGNTSIPGSLPGMGGVSGFGKIAEGVKEARLVRSETLQVDGVSIDCYVIEFVPAALSAAGSTSPGGMASPKVEPVSETVWVDKDRLLVTRVNSHAKVTLPGESTAADTESNVTFTHLTLNDPLPDDTFVFTPPVGATEMDLSQFMPQGASPQ